MADIGDLPKVAKPKRKAACKRDLHKYLTTYFPNTAGLKPFGEAQKALIASIQAVILRNGKALHRFPRGYVKTTISELAALWATSYGHRHFVPIFGANRNAAHEIIESIRMELAENDLLYEDFPEVCHAIRALEGKVQRCRSQTYQGQPTYIEWSADTIVLPTIPKSAASGAIIKSIGIKQASRGMRHKCADGEARRPDFFIVDDPQTDDGARSEITVNAILSVLKKAIGRAGGHNRGISGVVNATPICAGDVVEKLSNPKLFPAWRVQRAKMMPRAADAHETFWLGDYARVRNEFDRSSPDDQKRAHAAATALYKSRREEADAGCEVSWRHCYSEEDGEISAIQHAYNILIDDGPEVFASECQDEPVKDESSAARNHLTPELILGKLNGLARGVVPKSCEWLTAAVDMHDRLLYWTVAAWSPTFGGGPVDYGTYPKQSMGYFAQASAPIAMADVHRGLTEEAWLLAGLTALVDQLTKSVYTREDGLTLRISSIGIDSRWKKELVWTFCRRHPCAILLTPTMGHFIGATSKPFDEYKPESGARNGMHWRFPPPREGQQFLLADVNWWKTQAATRLALPKGTPGGWEISGGTDQREHILLADHYCSEEPVDVSAKGRNVAEWKWKPGRPDNHWWDNLVICAVLGSILGAKFGVEAEGKNFIRKRPKVSYL